MSSAVPLIEKDMIPDDVTIQVLTQARPHIIKKTFEAIDGAKNAIVHLYNSTSYAQRTQVFKKSQEEILQLAVDGAKLLNQMAEEHGVNYPFEYSPESFTGTEIDYALEVCNAVIKEWKPTPDRKGYHQPSCNRRDVTATCICKSDRVHERTSD